MLLKINNWHKSFDILPFKKKKSAAELQNTYKQSRFGICL